MVHNSESTQIPDIALDTTVVVEAQLQELRANFANTLTTFMAGALGVLIFILGILWLLSPNHTQFLIYDVILGVSLIGFLSYPTFRHRGQARIGSQIFLLGFLLVDFFGAILLPAILPVVGVGYVFIVLMGSLLLGKKAGSWLILICLVAFLTNIILVHLGVSNFFPILDETITLITTIVTSLVAFPTAGFLIQMIVVGQEDQFRRAQLANLDLERRAEIEQEQRDQLQQANQEIETRATSEQEQREQLQHLVTQVQSLISNLNSVAAEIQASTTQQTASATEQDATVTQTVATVEELRTTISQAAERANAVAGTSQDAREVSRNGQNSVTESIKGMTRIRDQVESIAENILILSKQTQQIGDIINTVNGLSEQSKLLALNASIEAARAGEEGKGFAVVAMEVRQLAEQSRQATERVRGILSEIQQATNTAVMVTEEGSKGAEQGMSLVEQAGAAIQELTITIEDAAQSAMQIAASSQQQSNGMEQLMTAMNQIKLATSQTAASTRQTEQSITNLVQIAQDLETTASVYRLPNGASEEKS